MDEPRRDRRGRIMDLTKKANAMRDKVRERVRSDMCVCVHYVGVYKERERVHVCVCQESM